MGHIRMTTSVFVAAMAAGCSTVEVIDASVATIDPDACSVTVYQTETQARRRGDIEELCIISGSSSGSFSHTVATAIRKHKDKACACGANNVYVQSRREATLDLASVTLVAFRYKAARAQ